MNYAISDIHGCYNMYIKLLEKIKFSSADILYVIGDICDRGDHSIEVYQDLMKRENVHVILGNHDYMLLQSIADIVYGTKSDNVSLWIDNGGRTTFDQILQLSDDEIQKLIKFISSFSRYECLTIHDKKYILIHSIPYYFREDKSLDEYDINKLLWGRPFYTQRYFKDENKFLVTGHTPTKYIRNDGKYEIFKEKGHIAIDCGCVYGGKLCAYCFETEEAFYVP